MTTPPFTTGLTGLDQILKGLLPGDNLVWQIDSMADYKPFVTAASEAALASGKVVVYFRFGRHEPLISAVPGAVIHTLHPEDGFEKFIGEIHKVIDETRSRGLYIFDCLSDLAVDWSSDRMLGNFFRLTCPYVYDVEGLAYFALLKNYHSPQAVSVIAETTQILIDVYRHQSDLYLHPLKVQQRHSPTMYLLHVWEGEIFHPVTESATIARIMSSVPYAAASSSRPPLGVWAHPFLEAEEEADLRLRTRAETPAEQTSYRHLLRMLLSRDDRILELAEKYLTLDDILRIWRRVLGTGLIGGKAVGMLLSRAVLRAADPRWTELLEEHDSFYLGSDVFYTYLIQNGCWWIRAKQRDPANFLEGSEEGRRRILTGTFPPDVQQEFAAMLEYFGQCPIIVRSSSLLEDAFGNAFAGKYDSVFCVNQGPPNRRLDDFMSAVRFVYASTMSERALRYRSQRGILDRDEQMSLLVQRVSGAMHGSLFFPQAAGVGLSYNPYAWNERIDPAAGVVRLVFGLGTRAVDRIDDDYTRVVALNAPELRPESGFDQVRRYAQRRVDVLDLAANRLLTKDFIDVLAECPSLPIDMFASRDEEVERRASETGKPYAPAWVLTFERLLSETPFARDMRDMLRSLEQAYGCPVDTEFTLNFFGPDGYRINMVQCRPLQVHVETGAESLPADIGRSEIVFDARGGVVGHSRQMTVQRLIYVVPSVYGQLPVQDRYRVARLIGRIFQQRGGQDACTALLGPGRWGTTTPSLGVPVTYADISGVTLLCEIVAMREGLVPEVSLGTHFFNQLVEDNVLYLALFPGRDGNLLNESFFRDMPNRLEALLPDAAEWTNALQVIDASDILGAKSLQVNANHAQQRVVCYVSPQQT